MATARPPVQMKGVPDDLLAEIELRVTEFERDHEPSVLRGGPGAVPRIRRIDYAAAIVVNLVLVIWLIIAFVGGGQ